MTRSKIRTSGAEGLTLSSTALTVANGLTLSDGDIAVASGHGLSFAATSDAGVSTPSELLEDYEEGTWTPGILNGWGVTSPTYSQNTGFYTKIGNVCHVSFRITLSGGSFNSNRLTVEGFPFTAGSNTSDTIHTINGFFDTASSNAENVFLKVVDNGVYPSFHARTASGISDFTGLNADTAFNLCFSGSYFTT